MKRIEVNPLSLDDVLVDSDSREIEPREAPELYVVIPPKELVVWSLFSAGGMVAAFLVPVHVAILGLAFAAGWLPDDALSFDRVLGIVRFPLTRLYLGVLIALPLYHWAHRFRYAIHHQLGVHGWKRSVAFLCYGTALAGTVVTVIVLIRV